MAKTQIADIIVPEVFTPYVQERTAEIAALLFGGIISNDDGRLDELARSGGKIISMPFFKDLTGEDEILSDSGSLTPEKITTDGDYARLNARGKAWSVNDLAKALSGADPMGAIADLVASFWARKEQATLVATCRGILADNVAGNAGDMLHSVALETSVGVADANRISASAVIDAAATMGDAAGGLTAMVVNSAVYATMQKQELITTERPAGTNIAIERYLNKYQVIVDDNLPTRAGTTSGTVHQVILFGNGAIGRGEGAAPVPVETDRDSLAGDDVLITRRHFLMHPRGIKWTETAVAAAFPTNTELQNATNWTRVYERKNVRMAFLEVNA